MRKKKIFCIWAMAIFISGVTFTGCSSETKIEEKQVEKTQKKEENTEIDQSSFLAFEEKELLEWNQEEGIYPQVFYVTFSNMSEEEVEEAWNKIEKHNACETLAILESATIEHMLEAAPENINPAYLEWNRSEENESRDPRVLENPGRIRFQMVYTMEDAEENILFETKVIDDKDVFNGNFVVNFKDKDTVTVDSYRVDGEVSVEQFQVKLDKVTTEPDWMLDTEGFGVYLKLKKEEFEKIVPEEYRTYEYFVKAAKGKEKELREYVKQVGGYVYEESYYK